MTQPYVGEIRMFGGNFAPSSWAFCNGQTLAISQYQVLFTLIGTTYGGNGTTTFNLPNLQGQLAVGMGQGPGLSNYPIGQTGGVESVTLTTATMGGHNHPLNGHENTATFRYAHRKPQCQCDRPSPDKSTFTGLMPGSPTPTWEPSTRSGDVRQGGSLPHPNMMPSLCVSFIISLFGMFPSQS